MPQPPSSPGIYVEEVSGSGIRVIAGVETSITAFVGHMDRGVTDQPVRIDSFADFEREFGGLSRGSPTSYAVHQFFLNGGRRALVVRAGADGSTAIRDDLIGLTPLTGMNALLEADEFNLLCIPETFDLPDPDAAAVADAAIALCESRRAFYLVDPPKAKTVSDIVAWADILRQSRDAAIYFPALRIQDPLDNRSELAVAPSGSVAGVYARIDSTRGLWKAPAGMEATLAGVTGLAVSISTRENDELNSNRINALRYFPGMGHVVWGARTLKGADSEADDYKYVSVRRLTLFIVESIYRGTQWTAFEANDESTWSQVRLDVSTFMQGLFRDGALQGSTPNQAYFVRCGADTTTQADMAQGLMHIEVGFAPVRPGEFLIVRIRQRVGDITV